MNFDTMPWLVTAGDVTYGPQTKAEAAALETRLRAEGQQAVGWAAQLPDPRRITAYEDSV